MGQWFMTSKEKQAMVMKSDRCASFHSSVKQARTFQLQFKPSKDGEADLVTELRMMTPILKSRWSLNTCQM